MQQIDKIDKVMKKKKFKIKINIFNDLRVHCMHRYINNN